MTEEKSRKRVQKIQRVQLACIPCRQAKLKCNRESPTCDQCYKRSRETSCLYTERGLRYNAAKGKAGSMKEKIDRLENFVNQLKDAGGNPLSTPVNSDLNSPPDGADQGLSPSTGNLRISHTGSTQYIGPTHWESIIEDIAEVKAYFDLESSPGISTEEDIEVPLSSVPSTDILFGISLSYSKEDLLVRMPPKSAMDRFIATWFNSADSLRCMLHAPTFQQEYHQFWQSQNDASISWLALLFSVAGVGAETSGQLRQDKATLSIAENLRRLTAHALVLADYTNPQPYIIESLIMHIKSIMIKLHEVSGEIWLLFGVVARLCTRAGYHRDPSNNPAISPLDCEMRRRIWAFVCEYDILISYQCGMASVINQQKQDTARPANLLDSDLTAETIPPSRSLEEATPMGVAIVYGKLVSIFGDVIYCSHTLNHPSANEISQLNDRLTKSRNDLPQRFRMVPIDQSLLDPPDLILNRYKLEFIHLKAICVLYRRYLGLPNHLAERKHCLDAAEELVRIQIDLLEASQPDGQLASFLVLVRRHVHDLDFSALLLCSDLKEVWRSAGSQEQIDRANRTVPLLLRACGLWRVSGITSPKSRHALRAVELFLRQKERRDVPTDKADQPGVHAAGDVQSSTQGLIPSDTNMFANAPFNGFDIEQDPLYQDLFGQTFSDTNAFMSGWQ